MAREPWLCFTCMTVWPGLQARPALSHVAQIAAAQCCAQQAAAPTVGLRSVVQASHTHTFLSLNKLGFVARPFSFPYCHCFPLGCVVTKLVWQQQFCAFFLCEGCLRCLLMVDCVGTQLFACRWLHVGEQQQAVMCCSCAWLLCAMSGERCWMCNTVGRHALLPHPDIASERFILNLCAICLDSIGGPEWLKAVTKTADFSVQHTLPHPPSRVWNNSPPSVTPSKHTPAGNTPAAPPQLTCLHPRALPQQLTPLHLPQPQLRTRPPPPPHCSHRCCCLRPQRPCCCWLHPQLSQTRLRKPRSRSPPG
jgi:hypothetical protein